MQCSITYHDPLRGIVDEACPDEATGEDGLCDHHRRTRARNQAKRAANKARKKRYLLRMFG